MGLLASTFQMCKNVGDVPGIVFTTKKFCHISLDIGMRFYLRCDQTPLCRVHAVLFLLVFHNLLHNLINLRIMALQSLNVFESEWQSQSLYCPFFGPLGRRESVYINPADFRG